MEEFISHQSRDLRLEPRQMKSACVMLGILFLAFASRPSSGDDHSRLGVEHREARLLARDVEGSAPSWASDGSAIVLGSARGGIVIVPVGRKPVQVISGNPFHNGPTWAPIDNRIAFVDESPDESKGVYVVKDLHDPDPHRLPLGEAYMAEQPWSPDGDSLLYWTDTGEVRTVGVTDQKPKSVLTGGGSCVRGGISQLRWNRSGSITATGATSGVMILRPGESAWRCLSERSGRQAIEGPNGVVWWIAGPNTLEVDHGGERKRVTLDGDVSSLDVNPRNGSAVVAVFKKGLFLVSSDGSDTSRLIGPSEERTASGAGAERYPSDGAPVWSPDGTMVAFVRLEGPSSADLRVVSVEE
jgi:Tol biopolymer transport system component